MEASRHLELLRENMSMIPREFFAIIPKDYSQPRVLNLISGGGSADFPNAVIERRLFR